MVLFILFFLSDLIVMNMHTTDKELFFLYIWIVYHLAQRKEKLELCVYSR